MSNDEWGKFVAAQRKAVEDKISTSKHLIELWCSMLGVSYYHANLEASLPMALTEFGADGLCEAISIVASRRQAWADETDPFTRDAKYFYGILRKWRKEEGK